MPAPESSKSGNGSAPIRKAEARTRTAPAIRPQAEARAWIGKERQANRPTMQRGKDDGEEDSGDKTAGPPGRSEEQAGDGGGAAAAASAGRRDAAKA